MKMESQNDCVKSAGGSRGIVSATRGFIGFVWNGVQGLHETNLQPTKATSITSYNWVTTDDSRMIAELERWRSQAYASNSRYQVR